VLSVMQQLERAAAEAQASPPVLDAEQAPSRRVDLAAAANVRSPVPMRVRSSQPATTSERTDRVDKAASAVGSPVPLRVKSSGSSPAATPPPAPPPIPAAEGEAPSTGKAARRDKRVAAQTPATLWNERMRDAVSCIIRDKSASGAQIELAPNKFGDPSADLAVGDRFTLTINIAREKSSVACEVVRVQGRRAGVRFCGPFHTEINKPRKTLKSR
jgi:hypothetical protein